MTTEELDDLFEKKIQAECMFGDEESDHAHADDILIALIEFVGFTKTAAAWKEVGKWYA